MNHRIISLSYAPVLRFAGFILLGIFTFSCASPTTHPVYIRDQGTPEAGRFSGVPIGLQGFTDDRKDSDRFLIGYRTLGQGKRERYATIPVDVADAVTRAVADRLGRMGARLQPLKGWDLTPGALAEIQSDADYLITGEILRLRCDAKKELLGTNIRLEAELVFYLGNREKQQVSRRPVQVQMERFEPIFNPKKVERFVNEALTEAMDRGLGSLN